MADRVGQQLGNYRLIRLLGRGGFAEVYLGEHLHLGTQAAVKVLHTRLASHDDVEGFEKEARTVAHLKHPHIVRVLDYDVEEDTPFLVMDYAVGGTLRNRYPKGTRLSLTTIISYVKQVADALQYAHDQRVIHRDIKPENMLVGEHDELLLSDFGIAIVAQSSRYQNTKNMGGTMAYIAPEQIQGHPRPASDQYSLGIVVYEWLSGDCPFHGSMTEIVAQHLAASPPPLQEKLPIIAPEVEQVVLTALEKDPRQRFHSVKAFATALEQAYQNTQASPELPRVPSSSSASVTAPGEQALQTERSVAEIAPAPEHAAFQTPLMSPLSVPSPPETPSVSPVILSSSSHLPTIPAQSFLPPDEPRTGQHTRQEAPANLGTGSLPMPIPGSSRPRKLLIPAVSIVVASVLLAALLGNWFVSRELVRTPTPTPRATPIPAGIITEFSIPTAKSTPNGLTAGPDSNLWFVEFTGNKIGRITPNGSITEFPIPTAQSTPQVIVTGPDGNLWFDEGVGNKIGRITPNGSITEFPIPTANSGPGGFTIGPDGNLWFSEELGNKIGRITPSGTITEFPLPAAGGYPDPPTVGPDGNLWFSEVTGNKIGRITPSGSITEFSVPTAQSRPIGMIVGPDGNLWFAEWSGNKIGRISTSGTITEFPIPAANIVPVGITVGPDGNLWFSGLKSNKIWRITPSGIITAFPVPPSHGVPVGFIVGPDHNLWSTDLNSSIIRISTSGIITEFSVPTAQSDSGWLTVGPDHNLWFTEGDGNKIGRITSGR